MPADPDTEEKDAQEGGSVAPPESDREKDEVQEQSEESFPASDPPSY